MNPYTIYYPNVVGYPVGWVCPRCQKVNAPHVPSCDCKPTGVPGHITATNT